MHSRQECCPVHSRHAHVGHDDIERHAGHLYESGLSTVDKGHLPLVALHAEHALETLQDSLLVVDEEDLLHAVDTSTATFATGSGRRMRMLLLTKLSRAAELVHP